MFKMTSSKPKRPVVNVERTEAPAPRILKMLMDLRPDWQREANRAPGPSKLMYRLTRSWKKKWLRNAALIGLPVVVFVLISARIVTDPIVQRIAGEQYQAFVAALSERPEFAVRGVNVAGASQGLKAQIMEAIDLGPDASSLSVDVADLQIMIGALPPVKRAHVVLSPDGVLQIDVRERIAEALWRDPQGALWLVDREGVSIARVADRAAHPHLPVVLGEGAPDAMDEALALFRSVPDLTPRLRAIVRIGKRRWDIALDKNLRILLPEQRPVDALQRVMALHYGEEILDRDLLAVDMRISSRPTLRMHPEAVEALRLRAVAGEGEET
ncbi:MAG: cell division protein FtsQ/DivIB [Pseudomonadota bacterium]